MASIIGYEAQWTVTETVIVESNESNESSTTQDTESEGGE